MMLTSHTVLFRVCGVSDARHLKTDYVDLYGGGMYCHYENSCDESTTCGGAVHVFPGSFCRPHYRGHT